MLNSSRDTCTLLDLKPTFASVLKLAVVTVLAVASLAAMFAIFPQLHPGNAIFTMRTTLHNFPPYSSAPYSFLPIISELLSIPWPTYIILKIILEYFSSSSLTRGANRIALSQRN